MAERGVQSWHERLWRANNVADIARGQVRAANPFSAFGDRVTGGSVARSMLWTTGMPTALTVPQGISLTFVSSGADTRRVKLVYLDGDLDPKEETVTLTGTTSVTTQATDIRFVNRLYSLDGPLNTTVTATSGGVQYARINPNLLKLEQALYRVPRARRLMLTALYAGSASSSADARVVIKINSSFFNGDSFADQGFLHSIGGIALQDSAATLPFGPFPIPAGEIIAMTISTDKGADVLGGFFGWEEPE